MLIVFYSQIFVSDGNMITVEDNHTDATSSSCQVDVDLETDRPMVALNHACQNQWTTLTSQDCGWHTPNPMGPHLMTRRFDLISKKDDDTCVTGHYVIELLEKSKQIAFPNGYHIYLRALICHLPIIITADLIQFGQSLTSCCFLESRVRN